MRGRPRCFVTSRITPSRQRTRTARCLASAFTPRTSRVLRGRPRSVLSFFQAEDGIRYYKVTGVQDVCSSDLLGRLTVTLPVLASVRTYSPTLAAYGDPDGVTTAEGVRRPVKFCVGLPVPPLPIA